MRFTATFAVIGVFLINMSAFSQSAFAPLNADYYHLIDRYEIKNGRLSNDFHSDVKPFLRKNIIDLTEQINENKEVHLTPVDKANLAYLQNDSWEWLSDKDLPQSDGKKPLFKEIFKKKSDFYQYQNQDVDIHVSPIFNFGFGTDNLAKDKPSVNTRGIEIRGTFSKKLGFYTELTENQIVYPEYVRRYIRQSNGFPYEGFTKVGNNDSTKLLADFFSARAYVTFQALKHLQFQFGHDKNFIGSGIRSLILSDFSAPYLQLKVITSFGRFQYMNIFSQMLNRQLSTPGDSLIPTKYMAFHHLNFNITNNLSVGLFETIMFGKRPIGYDINYLNPVIFYRYLEGNLGSADNSIVGLDFKYNFLKHASIYGQIVLDEYVSKHISAQDGWWGNKYAMQFGGKYIDALGISNLDLQAEYNFARPYTYAHYSTYSNFVNYNLPLANPLGANFKELLLVARYQPLPKLFLAVNYDYIQKGEDFDIRNWGGDLLKLSQFFRPLEYGNTIGQGQATTINFLDIGASYMLKHNLFFDLHYQNRVYKSQDATLNYTNTNISFGIRWNTSQRPLIF